MIQGRMMERLLSRKFLGSSAVSAILLEQGRYMLASILTAVWVAVQGVVDGIEKHHEGVSDCVWMAQQSPAEDETVEKTVGWRTGHGTVVVSGRRDAEDIEGGPPGTTFGFKGTSVS